MNVYEVITAKIVEQLEQGVVPWRKPWRGAAAQPRSLSTNRPYRGVNAFLLACTQYDSPYWVTYRQAQALGGQVRKGEKSMPIVFWKFWDPKSGDAPEAGDDERPARRAPLLRYYAVFNVAQCDLPADAVPSIAVVPDRVVSPIAACDAVIDGLPVNRPVIEHDYNHAFYRPSADLIGLPPARRFESDEHYYATLFHELTHSTGHTSRLARKSIVDGSRFGSDPYSQEELVAEMGAAFLCGHCGIGTAPLLENSAAYVASWLTRLKGDSRLVVMAAAQAQKAVDWVLGQQFAESTAAADDAAGKPEESDDRGGFALANDPPKPVRPPRVEGGPARTQRALLAGLDCLPGQLNLFATDGE